jgi:hypothetical protein
MPVLNQSQLDDPLLYDGSESFAGGQVSNVRANLLQKNEAAQLINFDITRTGELRTRRDTVRLGSGTAGSGSGVGANDYAQGRVFLPLRVRARGVNSYIYSIARLVSESLGAGDPIAANA